AISVVACVRAFFACSHSLAPAASPLHTSPSANWCARSYAFSHAAYALRSSPESSGRPSFVVGSALSTASCTYLYWLSCAFDFDRCDNAAGSVQPASTTPTVMIRFMAGFYTRGTARLPANSLRFARMDRAGGSRGCRLHLRDAQIYCSHATSYSD